MQIPETTIEINGKNVKVIQNLKANLAYERGTGKSALATEDTTNLVTMVDMFFFAVFANNTTEVFDLTKEQFEDYLNDHPQTLGEYTGFLHKAQLQAVSAVKKQIEESEKGEKKETSK